jgi:hypothetical protein
MKARIVPLILALAPVAAIAQTTYSRAEIIPPRLNVCDVQQDRLFDRKAALEMDQRAIDRERDAIEREGSDLAAQLRVLASQDTAGVAAYNARSAAHNERVAAHNRYVNATNRAAALLNGDSAEFVRYCDTLRLSRR